MTVFVYTFCDKGRDMVMLKTCSYSVHDFGTVFPSSHIFLNVKKNIRNYFSEVRNMIFLVATEYNIHYSETPQLIFVTFDIGGSYPKWHCPTNIIF